MVVAFGHSFESVLEAAKLGSHWAWVAIYREIAGPVTGFLRARGVNDPEDAAGDVFFEISRSIGEFTGDEDSFHTRVFVMAHQRMVRDRHSERPPRSRLADRVLDRVRRDSGTPDFGMGDDVGEELRRAFETLSQDQRDILALRVVGALSVEQTAEVLNRGIDTVRSLQRKALAKVRRITPGEVVLS